MSSQHETNPSLIMRLPSQSDIEAWGEFARIYEPMVYQFGRRRGLQDADARELVQNVMIGVAKAVARWTPDGNRGRFRTWLYRIARNQWITLISKKKLDVPGGGTSNFLRLMEHAEDVSPDKLRSEYRRELFRIAAAKVRDSFQPKTWEAFWRTAVLEQSVEQAARELGMTAGAIYLARGRVTHRLQETIQGWEHDDQL